MVLAIGSTLVLFGTQHFLRQSELNDNIRVESYRSRNDLITTYILVYIFPFVVLDFNNPVNWLVFITFFFVIGTLQVRSNQLHVNPVLAFLRYDIYEVNNGTQELMLVTKNKIDPESETIQTTKMTDGVYIVP